MSDGKTPFLVCWDYGTGGVWSLLRARSEQEIIDLYPELDVVHDSVGWLTTGRRKLQEVDIDGAPCGVLNSILQTRAQDERRSGNDRPVFLVGIGDVETGAGSWLFLHAHTELELRDRYPELTVVHGRPEWARTAVRAGRVVNTAHDIEEPPSGLLADIVARRGNGGPGDQSQRR